MNSPASDVRRILKELDPRYKLGAYELVNESLSVLQREVADAVGKDFSELETEERHVSPRELVQRVGECAKENYGLLAKIVLRDFGIHTSDDIGNVIINLIKVNRLYLGENESEDDFKQVGYDLAEDLSNYSFDY